MWSYYGSKSRVVDLYPRPLHNKIIEPFAGSARYSLKYWENDILLVDKYDVVIKVWHYLQKCSPKDILGLPQLTEGLDISKLNISDEEKMFLGINAGVASVSPRNKVSSFIGQQNGRYNKFKIIAANLYKIKHWKIIQDDFSNIENKIATWFIDSPYQFGGMAYIENKIDFNYLGQWSKERIGQVIVCENMKANWLPFVPLSVSRGANGRNTTEAIWTNYHTHYNNVQQQLF